MKWIWADDGGDSSFSKSYANINSLSDEEKKKYTYRVVSFCKTYSTCKKIISADLEVSGDIAFRLFANGCFIGLGPVCSGGDFLCTGKAPKHYFNRYSVSVNSDTLEIKAFVKLLPEVLTEYGRCRGGFALEGELIFEDGTREKFCTGPDWNAVIESSYDSFRSFNSLNNEEFPAKTVEIGDVWHAEDAPIPMLSFTDVLDEEMSVPAGEKKEYTFALEKIYGAYPVIRSDGRCRISLETSELPGQATMGETAVFGKAGEYFSFRMHSVGFVKITAENIDCKPVTAKLILRASMYPVEREGTFRCSDEGLNKVYEVCKHTLKICRQTIHLDSTKHQELLACTGDYYIETLISLYAFGDVRLSAFDVMRTADWLAANDGRMFHTTYSLIWVQMLHDVYLISGDTGLLRYCEKALDILLKRFESYMGESGVLETPPDYMFVDWTVIDGYSMHHPPKALGQTVLNAFYYEALNKASEIYSFLGRKDKKNDCIRKAAGFFDCFNYEFFDTDYQLYSDGKNDEDKVPVSGWHPENSSKKYISKYPNILAVLYGLALDDDAESIMIRIVNDDTLTDIQPYFMHYMIGALRRTGLFAKYGMKLLDRWKAVTEECDKGLKEGWIAPEEGYSFDHSHAWGGTVAYQLPSVITGMNILEPGMKKLSFSPCLYGLESAFVEIPTDYGMITVSLEKGRKPEIQVPDGIEYRVI